MSRLSVWETRPAPERGSPARARYERSAVFARRQRAAVKAAKTRRQNAARGAAKKQRAAKQRAWRKAHPEVAEVLRRQLRALQRARQGRGPLTINDAHSDWYSLKSLVRELAGETAFGRLLTGVAKSLGLPGRGPNSRERYRVS